MKKMTAFLLSVVFVLAAFSSVVSSASNVPTFAVSEVSGKKGETVSVDVCVSSNPGIVSLKLMVNYDKSVLHLVSAEGVDFSGTSFGPITSSPIAVNWVDAIHPNNSDNGVVARLTFEILDAFPGGKTDIVLTYDPEDVYNSSFDNVYFDVKNGGVKMSSNRLYGDADGDGELTAKDLKLMVQYMVGIVEFDKETFDVMDVDRDGEITARDRKELLIMMVTL